MFSIQPIYEHTPRTKIESYLWSHRKRTFRCCEGTLRCCLGVCSGRRYSRFSGNTVRVRDVGCSRVVCLCVHCATSVRTNRDRLQCWRCITYHWTCSLAILFHLQNGGKLGHFPRGEPPWLASVGSSCDLPSAIHPTMAGKLAWDVVVTCDELLQTVVVLFLADTEVDPSL